MYLHLNVKKLVLGESNFKFIERCLKLMMFVCVLQVVNKDIPGGGGGAVGGGE